MQITQMRINDRLFVINKYLSMFLNLLIHFISSFIRN